jgi:hypothetical protein
MKAELPSPDPIYGGAREVSMLNSERSYGISDYSSATRSRADDGSTFGGSNGGPRSSGPVLVDDRFMRTRMGGGTGTRPVYEVS